MTADKEIVAGNERVLRARLVRRKVFLGQDCGRPLAARVPDLEQVVFHAKAGSMLDRAHRIEALAGSAGHHAGFRRRQRRAAQGCSPKPTSSLAQSVNFPNCRA